MRWAVFLLVAACGRISFEPVTDATTPFGADADTATACAPAAGLVACWDFDSSVLDGSGNGNDLAASAISFTPGVAGQAVRTTASSDLALGENPTLTPGSGLSMLAWIRADELPNGMRAGIIDKSEQFGLWIHQDQQAYCSIAIFGVGSEIVPMNLSPSVGTWHHLACVFDGVEITSYVDGVAGSRIGVVGAINDSGRAMSVGHGEPTGEPFVGSIDRLQVWNRALSYVEICAVSGAC